MAVDQGRVIRLAGLIKKAFQAPLVRHRKVVTKTTFNSIQVVTTVSSNIITFDVFTGGGYLFIQRGKRANTKFPVRRVGGRFKLVKPLAEWKRAKGLSIPDFLLARSIAINPRRPINLIRESEVIITRILDVEVDRLGIGDEVLRMLTSIEGN